MVLFVSKVVAQAFSLCSSTGWKTRATDKEYNDVKTRLRKALSLGGREKNHFLRTLLDVFKILLWASTLSGSR